MSKFSFSSSVIAILFFYPTTLLASLPHWNLNDVSILFGLPHGGPHAPVKLLAPRDQGGLGELLPSDAYALLPTLYQPGLGNVSLYEKSLRVTAVRFDPCPPSDDDGCSAELRLVWQPVEYAATRRAWVTRDAAVHCIHTIRPEARAQLKNDLWRLKMELKRRGVDTSLQPLGVHPAIRNGETADAFTNEMRSLVLRYAGDDNLTRITFAALRVPTRWWRFGAAEKNPQGDWQRVDIPRLDAPSVDIFNVAAVDGVGLGPDRGLDAIFNVLPDEYPEEDNIFTLINKGYRFNDERDLSVFRQKLDAVARFRNPHRTNADNLDCASCHYADAALFYAENRFPVLSESSPVDAFENPAPELFNLHNGTIVAGSARVVRAFGYHDAQPAVSQRTINESALVAHRMNHQEPGQGLRIAQGLEIQHP